MIMGPVFMAAGMPVPGDDKHSDVCLNAVIDAVRGLLKVVLPGRVLVCRGSPAIAPIVWEAAVSLGCADKLEIYVPMRFANPPPSAQGFWARTVLIEDSSPNFTEAAVNFRTKMISSHRFVAGIFIGGGADVMSDWKVFRALLPDVPAYPVVSTGGAARCLLKQESNFLPQHILHMLSDVQAYKVMFRTIFGTSEPSSTQQ